MSCSHQSTAKSCCSGKFGSPWEGVGVCGAAQADCRGMLRGCWRHFVFREQLLLTQVGGSRRAGRMRIAYGSIIAGTMGWVGNHTWSRGKNRSIVPRGAQTGNGRAARPPSSIFSSLALIVSSATERMRCGVFSPARPSRRVMSSAPD
jgi:hypothetical protein